MRLPGARRRAERIGAPLEALERAPCCEECGRKGTRCDEEPARVVVGGVHERRRARARARDEARRLSGQKATIYGGAAASSSVPVSEGGTYRPRARRTSIGQLGEHGEELATAAPENVAVRAAAMLPDERAAAELLGAWARARPRSREELERASFELGLLGAPELAGALFGSSSPSSSPSSSRSSSRSRGRSSSRSSRPSWNERRRARVGQVFETDAGVQAAISSLDRDWNALAVSVCGTARGLLTCDTPTARELGPGWISEFRSTLGDWRTWRDDARQRVFYFALDMNAEIDGWRAELERFRGDAQRVTHAPATATPRAPEPSALEGLARGGERLAGEVVRPIGIALGVLAVLFGLSFLRR